MKRELQVAVANHPPIEGDLRTVPVVGFSRPKLFLTGLLFAAMVVAVLILILVIGSMLAALAGIVLLFAVVAIALKAMFRRVAQ